MLSRLIYDAFVPHNLKQDSGTEEPVEIIVICTMVPKKSTFFLYLAIFLPFDTGEYDYKYEYSNIKHT